MSENRRRTCLSAVEQLASDYRFMAENAASESYNNPFFPGVWKKSEAIDKIEWFADRFKNKLDRYLNPEEELRVVAKFNVIKNEAILNLEDNHLRVDLFIRIASIFKKIFDEILFENPSITLQPPFSLLEKDFQAAGMTNYQEYANNNRLAVCYDFAFYQLNEVKAFPYIFSSELAQWPKDLFNDTANFLATWGYEEVKEPSPGDLVVYSHRGNSRHFGIWTPDDRVLSKLGMNHVVKHPIDEVVLGYGDDVSFFRKRIN